MKVIKKRITMTRTVSRDPLNTKDLFLSYSRSFHSISKSLFIFCIFIIQIPVLEFSWASAYKVEEISNRPITSKRHFFSIYSTNDLRHWEYKTILIILYLVYEKVRKFFNSLDFLALSLRSLDSYYLYLYSLLTMFGISGMTS